MPASACTLAPGDGTGLQQDGVRLAWRSEPKSILQGQPFVLFVRLCPAAAELIKVDATMPEHRHGMNYKPSIAALGNGRFRVEGLLWHMSGRWEWRFDVRSAPDAPARSLLASVTLP
jgi:hypothetical protein